MKTRIAIGVSLFLASGWVLEHLEHSVSFRQTPFCDKPSLAGGFLLYFYKKEGLSNG